MSRASVSVESLQKWTPFFEYPFSIQGYGCELNIDIMADNFAKEIASKLAKSKPIEIRIEGFTLSVAYLKVLSNFFKYHPVMRLQFVDVPEAGVARCLEALKLAENKGPASLEIEFNTILPSKNNGKNWLLRCTELNCIKKINLSPLTFKSKSIDSIAWIKSSIAFLEHVDSRKEIRDQLKLYINAIQVTNISAAITELKQLIATDAATPSNTNSTLFDVDLSNSGAGRKAPPLEQKSAMRKPSSDLISPVSLSSQPIVLATASPQRLSKSITSASSLPSIQKTCVDPRFYRVPAIY